MSTDKTHLKALILVIKCCTRNIPSSQFERLTFKANLSCDLLSWLQSLDVKYCCNLKRKTSDVILLLINGDYP